MEQVTLGKTGITVNRNAFGVLPLQRTEMAVAVKILRNALEGGITFYDTARVYSDSEEKLGNAFSGLRDKIFIATKTFANTTEDFWKHLEISLRNLKSDYIDLYQFHNQAQCYKPGDGTGMYECMLEAKKQGKIRHIGVTNHRLGVAEECLNSGLYETLQFPFSYLSSDKELALVQKCSELNIGFIAMKALSGGLITDSAAAYAFISQFSNVLPIWGIQREEELQEFLSYHNNPPQMTSERKALIDKDKQELLGEFCRGCGYCTPCPAGIEIPTCARMSLLLRRSPSQNWMTPKAQEMMGKIAGCVDCGLCRSKCPYNLDTPELLKKNFEDYKKVLAGEILV